MWEEIQTNIQALRSAGLVAAPNSVKAVTYNFPLRLAPGLPDYAGFRVSAFADHNPATGQALDYNTGTRTYDGHRGTDYALWPFAWNKLDAGEMQVIAAAAGTILNSVNVDPTDHNCNVSSSDPWNYVVLLHADNRITIYGHMRYNSLTTKAVGQSVAQGEYLGTAASSGDSSGPHLHFEVRYGKWTTAEWIDPYAGPSSQPGSLWANQPPYFDSAINKLATHSSPPTTPDPCQPSIANLQDSFTSPSRIYFYAYYRDYQGSLATQLKLYRPDGSFYSAWQYVLNDNSFHSAWNPGWVFDFTGSDPAGTWRFEAAYNGRVYKTFFNINAPPAVHVNSPNGGEQWNRHLAHSVTWTDNLGGDVNIALYHNGVFVTVIAYNTPSDGEYLWTPDPAQTPGPGYTLRVSSVSNPAVYDISDAPFGLVDGPAIIARDDFALTLKHTPITIDVLANDEGPKDDQLTITAFGQPAHGTVNKLNSALIYTPAADFLGIDAFTYIVSTSTENAEAAVTVRVAAEIFHVSLPLVFR